MSESIYTETARVILSQRETELFSAAKEKLNEIISRGQVVKSDPAPTGGNGSEFNGYPAPSANELMNQNVAATAAVDGNVMVSNTTTFVVVNTVQEEIIIPHDKCGIVIGKNGNTLRNLRSQFGCSVNLDSTVDSGLCFSLFLLPTNQIRVFR